MTGLVNDKNRLTINSICGLLEISGDNSVDFLNNLLISDLNKLVHEKFQYTALCNPKGRIISSLWINILDNNHVFLICPINMHEELTSFFNMRKFRLKLEIKASDRNLVIYKGAVTFSDKYEKNALMDDFNLFMFNLKLPWIDKKFSEKYIPQHLNLDQHDGTMSFEKGCYPGQEIIARMKFLGKIKKRMVLLSDVCQNNLNNQIKDLALVSDMVFNLIDKKHYIQVIKTLGT